jgi:hypothetical protein
MESKIVSPLMVFSLISLFVADKPASWISPHVSAAQASSQPVQRKKIKRGDELIEEIRTLLEPQGITVNQSVLVDARSVGSYSDITVNWEAYPGQGELFRPNDEQKQHPSKKMEVGKKIKRKGSAVQPYTLELYDGDIFVAALGKNSQLKWWTVIGDPRILRADSLTPEGHIAGDIYYRPHPTIFLAIPDEPNITELRFLHVKLIGTAYQLETIGSVSLTN